MEMVKSNSRQGKHRELKNFFFGKTQEKYREFGNLKREIQYQEIAEKIIV